MENLKIRAWDGFNECYYYSDKHISLSAFFTKCEICQEGENPITYEWFTGEISRNKEELYVGDIVEIHFDQNSEKYSGCNPANYTLHNCVIEYNAHLRAFTLRNLTPKIPNKHNFGVIPFHHRRVIRDFITKIGTQKIEIH